VFLATARYDGLPVEPMDYLRQQIWDPIVSLPGFAWQTLRSNVSIEVEYGVGIRGSLRLGPASIGAGMTVHNTTSISANGTESGGWSGNLGGYIGAFGNGAELGLEYDTQSGLVPYSNTNSPLSSDPRVEFGGSLYFGPGGGWRVSVNLPNPLRHR